MAGDPMLVVKLVNGHGDNIEDPIELEGLDIRTLARFLDSALRGESCRQAILLMQLAKAGVWQQAYNRGHADGWNLGESRLVASADPLWRDGYEEGLAHALSERADDADRLAQAREGS